MALYLMHTKACSSIRNTRSHALRTKFTTHKVNTGNESADKLPEVNSFMRSDQMSYCTTSSHSKRIFFKNAPQNITFNTIMVDTAQRSSNYSIVYISGWQWRVNNFRKWAIPLSSLPSLSVPSYSITSPSS